MVTGKENGMSRLTTEAYDFSLFEEHRVEEESVAADSPRWDNTQPQEEPRRERREKPRENVVEKDAEKLLTLTEGLLSDMEKLLKIEDGAPGAA